MAFCPHLPKSVKRLSRRALLLVLVALAGAAPVACAMGEVAKPMNASVAAASPEKEVGGDAQKEKGSRGNADARSQFSVAGLDVGNRIALVALFLTALGGIWAFFTWIYPGVKEALTTNNNNKKYTDRYQEALAKELDKSNLPASNALDSFSLKLTDTFVSLRLSESWKCDTKFSPDKKRKQPKEEQRDRTPEEVMALVFRNNRLLLVIGDPGSGKTTLLKHYALTALKKDGYKTLGFIEPVMVFYLELRELKKSNSSYDSLSGNLFAWSEKHELGIPKAVFFNWLHKKRTLVLLDGLDEISDLDDRIRVCKWIDNTFEGLARASVVVTSRTTGYRKGDGITIETDHVRADIMDFSPEQQATYLKKWFYAAFLRDRSLDAATMPESTRSDALLKADNIIAYLAREENKSLQALAGVPLLLQIMATLWKDRQYLPESRVKLYDAALDYMLDYRDRQKKINPLLPAEKARRVLTPISLWMQEELKKDEAPRNEVQARMQEKLKSQQNPPSAEEFCRNLVERAGLLVEYGDTEYVFRHKSFREYMAGVQLKDDRPYDRLNKLVTHFGDDWWEEPLRFFIGQVDEHVFDLFMQKLFDSPVTDVLTQKQQSLLVTIMSEALETKTNSLQTKLLDPATTSNRKRYILACLKAIGIGNPAAIDIVRMFTEAPHTNDEGILLQAAEITRKKELLEAVHLFDGEKEVPRVIVDKQGAQYILIKGGSFTFYMTKKQETVQDLYVAKYTVTNQLYRRFISYLDAKEAAFVAILPVETYKKNLLALAGSNAEFADYLNTEKSLAERFRSSFDDNKRFNRDDQPVAAVSCYAATAYCLWLSLLESNGHEGDLYRLPTEKEWEYAAAGESNRPYPWPNEKVKPNKTLANYNDHEGATTPVGRYPEGATPEGLLDMAGNVWEWTEDLTQQDRIWRSIRGGAYYSSDDDDLRCSSRSDVNPRSILNGGVGFRVIRSSHSSSS